VGRVGVAFSPLDDYTPRASGLRHIQQCGVPTLVLVTAVRQKKRLCWSGSHANLIQHLQNFRFWNHLSEIISRYALCICVGEIYVSCQVAVSCRVMEYINVLC
jgi:hypothetical protein